MIKCEVIENFTLARFNELVNVERKGGGHGNLLKVHDTFECTEEMAKYLTGDNDSKKVVVKIIEVIPESSKKETIKNEEPTEEKPKRKKKTSKK